jgi:class 3 adenylate cyclase
MAMLRSHDAIVRKALATHGGLEVKHTGDGIMASFTSVTGAVQSAMEIQSRVAERNRDVADALRLRVGISCGEPVTEEGDLFGAAVELAARLCAHGGAGGILVSSAVREVCLGKGFEFDDQGLAELKGFEEPVKLYGVRPQAERPLS